MNSTSKKKLQKSREETSLKTMYFNRFLLIRYITAILFFSNLYWFSALLISNKIATVVPGVMLICMSVVALEQFTFFNAPTDNAKKSIISYKIALIINAILMVAVISPLFSELFPFLINNMKSKMLILSIITIGIILCSICLERLQKIKDRKDKQYKYVKQFEKTIRVRI
ncbi:hypothetical protein [Clostridium sp.]|uniref:hypothetical protein n=1 Tax=Clostridium sp. TaxID=1506 RepID=UPI003BB5C464